MTKEQVIAIVEEVLVRRGVIPPPKPERRPITDDYRVHGYIAGLAGVFNIDNSSIIQDELDRRNMYLAPEHLDDKTRNTFAPRVRHSDAFRGWESK